MFLENLEVIHKTFGKGTIVDVKGKYITVKFDGMQKIFVYPDSFEKFLTLADGSTSEEITADINAMNAQKQKALNEKNKENLQAMTNGIVIPGKENNGIDGEDEEGRFKNNEQEDI